jgi:chromosome segregation ATPase
VITIQSAMLVALGFLAATLLALLIAPAFWNRAVRLTAGRIKDTMPISDVELRADKDRIRAEYAIKVHRLESQVEQVKLAGARQKIELNRRDATINELEGALDKLKATHEETQNARRVLEQTVADRLPRVEQRLSDAKKLLFTRDQQISELTTTAERQRRALTEATQINAQQQSEIERLETSLTMRAARSQEGGTDPRFDGEVALRSEIEALRAKTREQAQLLARMQSMMGHNSGARPQLDGASENPPGVPSGVQSSTAVNGEMAEQSAAAAKRQLELERQLRSLKARADDQSAEITRLKAALAVFENEADSEPRSSLKESRIALKARMQSLEAQSNQQSETIQKLRSELASANERLARQATHFTAELKRLGAGTLPASGQARRAAEPARLSLAERVAQARLAPTPASTIPQPATKPDAANIPPAGPNSASRGSNGNGHGAEPSVEAATDAALAPTEAQASEANGAADTAPAGREQQRPRLLDRIATLSRS